MDQLITGFVVGILVGSVVTLIILSCIIVGAKADNDRDKR